MKQSHIVDFTGGTQMKLPSVGVFDKKKEGYRRLANLLDKCNPVDGQERIEILKRGIEVYLVACECTIVKKEHIEVTTTIKDKPVTITEPKDVKYSIREYFRKYHPGEDLVDVIVNSVNPDSIIKQESFYYFEDALDDMISDDLLTLWTDTENLKYLFMLTYPYRFNKIFRAISGQFTYNTHVSREKAFKNLLSLKWKSNEPINVFNDKFTRSIALCNKQDLMLSLIDQHCCYKNFVSSNRSSNQTVFAARRQLDTVSDSETLKQYQRVFSSIILQRYNNGMVPLDNSDLQFIGNSQLHQTIDAEGRPCMACGEDWPHSDADPCKAKGHRCGICGLSNHLEKVCLHKFIVDAKKKKETTTNQASITIDPTFSSLDSSNPFCCMTIDYPKTTTEINEQMCLLDTGANCNIFGDKSVFSYLFPRTEQSIKCTKGVFKPSGYGLVTIKFPDADLTYSLLAYYCEDISHTVLSDHHLRAHGINPLYGYQQGVVKFKTFPEKQQKIKVIQGLPFTNYEVVQVPFEHIAQVTQATDEHWHRRCMHLAPQTLQKTNIKCSHIADECSTCKQVKAEFKQATILDPLLAQIVEEINRRLKMDIAVPSKTILSYKAGIKAVIIIVDQFSRLIYITFVQRFTTKHILSKLKVLFKNRNIKCKEIVTDRQSAFQSAEFIVEAAKHGFPITLVPKKRHGEFNGLPERNIRTLRAMTCAALIDSGLDESFWPFGMAYSAFIKNRVYHHSIKMSPFKKHYGKDPNLKIIRRFGCVCYIVTGEKTNKFLPRTDSCIFLGFEENVSSVFTCICYKVDTKRLIFPFFQDVIFDEDKNMNDLMKEESKIKITYDGPSLQNSGSSFQDDESTYGDSFSNLPVIDPADTPQLEEMSENNVDFDLHGENDASNDTIDHSSSVESIVSDKEQQESVTNEDENIEKEGDTLCKISGISRSGRVITKFNLDPHASINFTVETSESLAHVRRTRTPAQKEKLKKKILENLKTCTPAVYSDLRKMKGLSSVEKDKYVEAARLESQTLYKMKVCRLRSKRFLPKKTKLLKAAMLLTKKRCGRTKGRMVINGMSQTFKMLKFFRSPTLSEDSLKTTCATAAHLELDHIGADVICAFPYAELPNGIKIYVEIPEGHIDHCKTATHVLEFSKNIYGTREGPMIWFCYFKNLLIDEFGFQQCKFDECVFVKAQTIVLCYVDDLLIFGKGVEITKLMNDLSKKLALKVSKLNEKIDFLGLKIERKGRNIQIDQYDYIKMFLKEFSKFYSKGQKTPLTLKRKY